MLNSHPLGNILIVDDDSNITDLLKYNLNSEGFGIDTVDKARDVDRDTVTEYRLIIADSMDNPYTGIDLSRDLKADNRTYDIPVILCTSRESEDLIITAFDNGVEDFVAKPFSLRELIARIKAILRRHPMKSAADSHTSSREYNVPEIKLNINVDIQKVTIDGEPVALTKTEYHILQYLVRNKGSFFTREDICKEVWKEDASSNVRIVDTNISRLRKKLGDVGKYITNRYGLGYSFNVKSDA